MVTGPDVGLGTDRNGMHTSLTRSCCRKKKTFIEREKKDPFVDLGRGVREEIDLQLCPPWKAELFPRTATGRQR